MEEGRTIEHIISKKRIKDASDDDRKALGFKPDDDLGFFLNQYGNLLLLEKGKNSEAQDKSLPEKKKIYEKSKLPFNKTFEAQKMNKNRIEERNKEAEKWLKEEFFKDFL